jgi:phosphate transport system permease protein
LTGVTLAIARAAGETAPLIFTALFSNFWPKGLFEPIATLSVLVYNFAIVPFKPQQELAWAASLILVLLVLITSVTARWVTRKQVY